MSFLRAYTAIDAGDPGATSAARVALTRQWMFARPQELFAELRQEQPIFATPAFVLLTRHAEVREVLARDDVFSVAPAAERLQPLVGNFLLGADDGPLHERDAALLRLAIRRGDLDDIAAAAEHTARVAVAAGQVGDRIDAVTRIVHPLVADFLARYIGVAGPSPGVLLGWGRQLARAAFCNHDNDRAVVDDAREAAAELRGYLDVLLASRRAQLAVGGPGRADAVGRLLAMQGTEATRIDDRRLRDLLIGLITCVVEPTVAAAAHVVHELAQRPEIQQRTIAAHAADDTATLTAIVDEALRFAPPLWTPARLCTRSFILARGTANETVLRPGERVLASTYSAGFDPAEVDEPGLFRPGRRAHLPLAFGAGLHACVGRHIAPILVRSAVTALLRVGPVRRVLDGIGHEGPFPAALALEFVA